MGQRESAGIIVVALHIGQISMQLRAQRVVLWLLSEWERENGL